MRKPSRLGVLKPLIPTMPQRLERSRVEKERQRFKDRDASNEWRAWYRTQRWRDLRQHVLRRDLYTCALCGCMAARKYPDPRSPVVDHREPHRGDEQKFWDESNLQCVCKGCHDSAKQSSERAPPR